MYRQIHLVGLPLICSCFSKTENRRAERYYEIIILRLRLQSGNGQSTTNRSPKTPTKPMNAEKL